jgi:hypothetical protein
VVDTPFRRESFYQFLHMGKGLDFNECNHLRVQNRQSLYLVFKLIV